MKSDKIIIGLTGPFGSGCTTLISGILIAEGFKRIALSEILREEYKKQFGVDTEDRKILQDFGNKLRETDCSYLAKIAAERIEASPHGLWIIDSIRNVSEVDYLKNNLAAFYLFAIQAEREIRYERVKEQFNGREEFDSADKRDNNENFEHGQHISRCYQMSDVIISNNYSIINNESDDFKELKQKVIRFIKVIFKKEKFSPNEDETCMAMAYANSLRSSCNKRKVGAVIIDYLGNVFSSGYNDVPRLEGSCRKKYGICYRDHTKNKFEDSLNKLVNKDQIANAEEVSKNIMFLFSKTAKMLDYCRSLHAEENAILNAARTGISIQLQKAKIYSTTFPCNMCANKIVEVGILKVIYFEPYPQEESKRILRENNVKLEPFEGATHKGYFRFMEDNK